MHPLEHLVDEALTIPFIVSRKGYIVSYTVASEEHMERLRQEFYAFTHPAGHLDPSRVIQLHQMGFVHEPIHSPEGMLLGYAVDLKGHGRLTYT